MLLTEQEIDDISREMVKGCKSVNWLAQKIESDVLEKLKAQGDVGVVVDNGTRGTTTIRRNDDIGMIAYGTRLYEHPLPPDDVVRDAARYKWLRDETNEMSEIRVINSTWEHLDEAIDAAMGVK